MMSESDIRKELEREIARAKKEQEIHCPYCDSQQDEDCGGMPNQLITYWGDGSCEMTCIECNKKFQAIERVRRTFDTIKLEETEE